MIETQRKRRAWSDSMYMEQLMCAYSKCDDVSIEARDNVSNKAENKKQKQNTHTQNQPNKNKTKLRTERPDKQTDNDCT